VRSLGGDKVLVTGMALGRTTLRVWGEGGESAYQVSVVTDSQFESMEEKQGVARVALEFLEMDSSSQNSHGIRWPEIDFGWQLGELQRQWIDFRTQLHRRRAIDPRLVEAARATGRSENSGKSEIHVRLGEEAVFHSGGEFPVPSTSESSVREYRHVEWKSYGLNVKVRPQSSDQIHLQSDIALEISEPNTALSVNGVPALTRRSSIRK